MLSNLAKVTWLVGGKAKIQKGKGHGGGWTCKTVQDRDS